MKLHLADPLSRLGFNRLTLLESLLQEQVALPGGLKSGLEVLDLSAIAESA